MLVVMFKHSLEVIGLMQDGKQFLLLLRMSHNQGLMNINRFFLSFDYRKTLPRAVILGVFIPIVVYVLVNFSFLCVLNLEEIKSSNLIVETFAIQVAGYIVSKERGT